MKASKYWSINILVTIRQEHGFIQDLFIKTSVKQTPHSISVLYMTNSLPQLQLASNQAMTLPDRLHSTNCPDNFEKTPLSRIVHLA